MNAMNIAALQTKMRRTKKMREYDFDIVVDGMKMQHRVCAVNKLAAYEELANYLENGGMNAEDAIVLNVYVHVFDEEDEEWL
jgi:hypothetical protein